MIAGGWLPPQLARFGIVGGLATLAHATTYALVVHGRLATPLTANVIGFLVAFSLSFSGHRHWTFVEQAAHGHAAILRFLVVALLGLGSNTLLTWLFVYGLRWPAQSALIGIVFITPAMVFLISKHWAFAAPTRTPD